MVPVGTVPTAEVTVAVTVEVAPGRTAAGERVAVSSPVCWAEALTVRVAETVAQVMPLSEQETTTV